MHHLEQVTGVPPYLVPRKVCSILPLSFLPKLVGVSKGLHDKARQSS